MPSGPASCLDELHRVDTQHFVVRGDVDHVARPRERRVLLQRGVEVCDDTRAVCGATIEGATLIASETLIVVQLDDRDAATTPAHPIIGWRGSLVVRPLSSDLEFVAVARCRGDVDNRDDAGNATVMPASASTPE